MTIIVRPSSPTGDFLHLDSIKKLLDESEGLFIFDESFLPFYGPDWLSQSAIQLIPSYKDRIFVITSWTKIWSCPGLRLGSVCSSEKWIKELLRFQVPWSVNSIAQKFLEACCDPKIITPYMEQTWTTLRKWKTHHLSLLEKLGWSYNENSPVWVPWIFAYAPSEQVAKRAHDVAMSIGIPVRWCKSYRVPNAIRFGIRDPKWQDLLFKTWMEDPEILHQNKKSN